MFQIKKKLAIITTHPIQYNAPLFQLLNERGNIDLKVFYTWGQSKEGPLYDPGFNKTFAWDIPLTEGYIHEFIKNISNKPGTKSFFGIINKGLIKNIKKYDPDAILIFGWSFYSHLKLIIHFAGKAKIIFRGDSTLLNEPNHFSIKKLLRRIFLKWVYSHVDYSLYVGKANKDYFIAHGLRNNQLHFAPHAIDNLRFIGDDDLLNEKASKWRIKLGFAKENIVLLFAGKLEYVKAPDILIREFLSTTSQNLRLLIVGNGEMESNLREMASNDNRIVFLDFQNQKTMPILYRMADIFVLPSRSETWGLAINEAMSSGRPVIVSDKVGCHLDLVQRRITGFIFNSSKPEELTRIMDELSSKEMLNEMGLQAKQKTLEYNYEKTCKTIEQILNA